MSSNVMIGYIITITYHAIYIGIYVYVGESPLLPTTH